MGLLYGSPIHLEAHPGEFTKLGMSKSHLGDVPFHSLLLNWMSQGYIDIETLAISKDGHLPFFQASVFHESNSTFLPSSRSKKYLLKEKMMSGICLFQ